MSVFNGNISVSLFGESHGKGIGLVLTNFHPGMKLDDAFLHSMLLRRKASGKLTTPRIEADEYTYISGVHNGVTTGFPICAVFENTNVKSTDYDRHRNIPRPSHADYTAMLKYKGFADMRGGGHFSGRLTLPLTFAGALCAQALLEKGIEVKAEITHVGGVRVHSTDEIEAIVLAAREEKDSVGGTVRICAKNVPHSLGAPLFGSAKSLISRILFAIPGVMGVSFGAGFDIATMRGSLANDGLYVEHGEIKHHSNHAGGIDGGITNGNEIVCDVAFRPTPSIAKKQESVNLQTIQNEELEIVGRHDGCIALRGCVVCEACVAMAIYDMMRDQF